MEVPCDVATQDERQRQSTVTVVGKLEGKGDAAACSVAVVDSTLLWSGSKGKALRARVPYPLAA